MPEINSQDTILIATSAIFFLLLILLFIKIKNTAEEAEHRADRLENTLARFTDDAMQDSENRLSLNISQNHLAIQSLIQEAQRSSYANNEHLSQRLDAALSSQDEKINRLTTGITRQLSSSDDKIERMRETVSKTLLNIQQDSSAKLEAMRKTVDESLRQTLTKSVGESFSLVNERLEQVYKGLGEMQSLAQGVGDIKRLFSNVKTRGVWGEMQLGALLENILTKDQYAVNVDVKPNSQERVEYAICLPGQEGKGMYLPIDAKFPIEAYMRLQDAVEAGDDEKAAKHKTELSNAILREAGRIADKYIAPPNTTDFAIMYLPMEALYAYVMQLSGLAESIQREKHVIISGPSTLSALLNSLQMGFRTLAIEQRSSDIFAMLRDIQKEFESFAEILGKTRMRLRQATDSIDSATRKTQTIERKLKRVESVEGEEYPNIE
ncbi:MAG: DNA recombination protein RmuC [Eubacteriales bacterium]|nr:DNA recombination protein RmuC [Eubacteriales bacterium]